MSASNVRPEGIEAAVACDLCSKPATCHPQLYYGRVIDRSQEGNYLRTKMSFSGPLLGHYCDSCVAQNRRTEIVVAALLSVVFGIAMLLILLLTDFPRDWTAGGLIVGGLGGASVYVLLAALFRSRERSAYRMLLEKHEAGLTKRGFGNFLDREEFDRLPRHTVYR